VRFSQFSITISEMPISLIGRLPLGKKGAIIQLKTRWLFSDVKVDRGPRERGGYRERKLSSEH
jgi:hypothetical protein